jgi:hypothetical protein
MRKLREMDKIENYERKLRRDEYQRNKILAKERESDLRVRNLREQ